MSIGSVIQVATLVLASFAWLFKKLRDRHRRERGAMRGEPEFQRNYEPIEVFGRNRRSAPR